MMCASFIMEMSRAGVMDVHERGIEVVTIGAFEGSSNGHKAKTTNRADFLVEPATNDDDAKDAAASDDENEQGQGSDSP